MAQYFSKEFFDALASALNTDAEWMKKASNSTFKTVITITDRSKSFFLDVVGGKVAVSESAPDMPADFKFEGPYESWVILGKGEKDFQSLVMTGKVKFRGSMPKVMGMMGQWNRLIKVAQELPKEF
ncbi:MAG TPA: SCP2 sterol-binding domain-containing protein [Thermoplasmata archaeon]|nr:SCP2 sterol-binding domain-containing protein [Thermoplasmata archaeon]